jgi:1-phosphatidylinositol-3-phosphate 5-kinase
VFAAYHLSLETSFFADEGATLPKVPSRPVIVVPDMGSGTDYFDVSAGIDVPQLKHVESNDSRNMFEEKSVSPISLFLNEEGDGAIIEHRDSGSPVEHRESESPVDHYLSHAIDSCSGCKTPPYFFDSDSRTSGTVIHFHYLYYSALFPIANNNHQHVVPGKKCQEVDQWNNRTHQDFPARDLNDQTEFSGEYMPTADNHQGILVSLSSTCIPKSIVCERPRLFRIKFYGSFDKPLGRYLLEDLFDQVFLILICI